MKIQVGYNGKKYGENFNQIFGNMIRRCMDCRTILGRKHGEGETHGLCPECLEERNKQLDETEKDR